LSKLLPKVWWLPFLGHGVFHPFAEKPPVDGFARNACQKSTS